ncbi:MAG: NYN domain-containing protein [Propionicimonas sp.]|uniref:NYN domain-containing protein n=1 Tax=Propionicimonas sp. TaxID=1955623 RepID=UPI002B21D2F9|nr:NYN domain-containing protein [Propionicimonas sp.]MEA4943209.1 NYN domain-containing protein [Propionicimonas sp.]MEA5055406.1 NYN domain-containing protein [Propionicimonas sp.]MEA5119570.1 NYN domain-containing protein [Propionicimonas sp.]
MPDTVDRIAILIDADNTSPKHVADILDELAQFGRATVKRAYGDWTTPQLAGWKPELNRHAIAPVQQFAYTTGKNSTDFALVIDAMDLLYSGEVDAFALVSSDSDFTRLATRLRESGKTVYGLGLRKTPESLVAAVDRFIYLELLGANQAAEPAEPEPAAIEAGPPLPNLQSILTKAVNRAAGDDGWAHLSTVGSQLRAADASFDPRLYGFDRLVTLVNAQPYLTVDTNGSVTRVGVKGTVPVRKPGQKKAAAAAQPTPAKKTAAPRRAAASEPTTAD